MEVFDIVLTSFVVLMVLTLVFLFFAKKRMDRNEPIFGWARKQHLEETGQVDAKSGTVKVKKGMEKIVDLLGIEDIKNGIFAKKNNEYSIIVESDFVNYDLLSDGARQAIIIGYSSLYKVIRFPVQILGQAVRQDLRKEEERFKNNLSHSNEETRTYNFDVIEHIKERSEDELRITRKVLYVISYVPQVSRMGAISKEDRIKDITDELYQRAWTIVQMLKQSDIQSAILPSLSAMEVMKRALNRERMVVNPIDDIAEREKLTSLFVTMDPTSLPGYSTIVNDVEEVKRYVQEAI
ncbi:MAG: hypothetical protein ACE3L7_33275 [Candidatus Pristimantibacillus sp.]